MMLRKLLFTGCLLTVACLSAQVSPRQFAVNNYKRYFRAASAHNPVAENDAFTLREKTEAMNALRQYFKEHPYRLQVEKDSRVAEKYLRLLNEQGSFSDLDATEWEFDKNRTYQKSFTDTNEDRVGLFIKEAYERIFQIVGSYRMGRISADRVLTDKLWKAVIHYGEIEIRRPNNLPRFHASCFAIPTAAVNIYFALLPEMDAAERGVASALMREASDMLKTVALQAWTQPLRNDDTDKNIVSFDRFRNHVWWVGGNALAYRSLLPVAVMYHSIPMVDLLSEICYKAMTTTSQATYQDSFWIEGFTNDGAGWGHGRQCLVWGYPIDGASSAMKMLNILEGTPWNHPLNPENTEALMNFFRGGNWYYYKGYRLPGLDRNSYVYNPTEKSIPYAKMLDSTVDKWLDSFTPEEQDELRLLQTEVKKNRIDMAGYPEGNYTGIRWFYNNDDLMKKTQEVHIAVNMASYRTDGLESAAYADRYNFYPTDGATLFQRDGNEYFKIMGGWDVTAMPGVTAREGMNKLTPVTNWRGYCSKHNLAAAATDKKDYAVAGWIFEKMHGGTKQDVNDKGNIHVKNEVLYGFKAYKSYFMMKDYFVALGSGITNMNPAIEGHIRTTIDQTAWVDEVSFCQKNKKQPLNEGRFLLNADAKKPIWLTQNGKFAYSLLPDYTPHAVVALETKPTNWIKLNQRNKKEKNLPKNVKILRISMDHGLTPVNDTYGYVVYTGKEMPADKLPFIVLRNDTLVQAIASEDQKVIQAFFYPDSDALMVGKHMVKVSSPCALVIEKNKKSLNLFVTDATMNTELKEIVVTIDKKDYAVVLPKGLKCGDTASLTVEL